MSVELEEFEPGRWRIKRHFPPPKRSALPTPMIISDVMDPVEQVDGRFYTSKSAFRRVGRQLGLVEIGTEKLVPKQKTAETKSAAERRKNTIRKAIAQYKSGVRPHAE